MSEIITHVNYIYLIVLVKICVFCGIINMLVVYDNINRLRFLGRVKI